MAKVFLPAVESSFFRYLSRIWDRLPQKDRDLLAEYWRGLIRLTADEYQHYLQVESAMGITTMSPYEVRKWRPIHVRSFLKFDDQAVDGALMDYPSGRAAPYHYEAGKLRLDHLYPEGQALFVPMTTVADSPKAFGFSFNCRVVSTAVRDEIAFGYYSGDAMDAGRKSAVALSIGKLNESHLESVGEMTLGGFTVPTSPVDVGASAGSLVTVTNFQVPGVNFATFLPSLLDHVYVLKLTGTTVDDGAYRIRGVTTTTTLNDTLILDADFGGIFPEPASFEVFDGRVGGQPGEGRSANDLVETQLLETAALRNVTLVGGQSGVSLSAGSYNGLRMYLDSLSAGIQFNVYYSPTNYPSSYTLLNSGGPLAPKETVPGSKIYDLVFNDFGIYVPADGWIKIIPTDPTKSYKFTNTYQPLRGLKVRTSLKRGWRDDITAFEPFTLKLLLTSPDGLFDSTKIIPIVNLSSGYDFTKYHDYSVLVSEQQVKVYVDGVLHMSVYLDTGSERHFGGCGTFSIPGGYGMQAFYSEASFMSLNIDDRIVELPALYDRYELPGIVLEKDVHFSIPKRGVLEFSRLYFDVVESRSGVAGVGFFLLRLEDPTVFAKGASVTIRGGGSAGTYTVVASVADLNGLTKITVDSHIPASHGDGVAIVSFIENLEVMIAEYVSYALSRIQAVYGNLVGVYGEDSPELRNRTAAIMSSLYDGPKVESIRKGVAAFVGLPITFYDGFVTSDGASDTYVDIDGVRFDFGMDLGVAINPRTGAPYREGDFVPAYSSVAGGVVVRDLMTKRDWWYGLIGATPFHELQKYHMFEVEVDDRLVVGDAALDVLGFLDRIRPIGDRFFLTLASNLSEYLVIESNSERANLLRSDPDAVFVGDSSDPAIVATRYTDSAIGGNTFAYQEIGSLSPSTGGFSAPDAEYVAIDDVLSSLNGYTLAGQEDRFFDASVNFISLGVDVNDVLFIRTTTLYGLYSVLEVVNSNELRINPSSGVFGTPMAGVSYSIQRVTSDLTSKTTFYVTGGYPIREGAYITVTADNEVKSSVLVGIKPQLPGDPPPLILPEELLAALRYSDGSSRIPGAYAYIEYMRADWRDLPQQILAPRRVVLRTTSAKGFNSVLKVESTAGADDLGIASGEYKGFVTAPGTELDSASGTEGFPYQGRGYPWTGNQDLSNPELEREKALSFYGPGDPGLSVEADVYVDDGLTVRRDLRMEQVGGKWVYRPVGAAEYNQSPEVGQPYQAPFENGAQFSSFYADYVTPREESAYAFSDCQIRVLAEFYLPFSAGLTSNGMRVQDGLAQVFATTNEFVLPSRSTLATDGAVGSNKFVDRQTDFLAAGVKVGDLLVINPLTAHSGEYLITSIGSTINANDTLTVSGALTPPFTPPTTGAVESFYILRRVTVLEDTNADFLRVRAGDVLFIQSRYYTVLDVLNQYSLRISAGNNPPFIVASNSYEIFGMPTDGDWFFLDEFLPNNTSYTAFPVYTGELLEVRGVRLVTSGINQGMYLQLRRPSAVGAAVDLVPSATAFISNSTFTVRGKLVRSPEPYSLNPSISHMRVDRVNKGYILKADDLRMLEDAVEIDVFAPAQVNVPVGIEPVLFDSTPEHATMPSVVEGVISSSAFQDSSMNFYHDCLPDMFSAPGVDWVASGVVAGNHLVVSTGPHAGSYPILSVTVAYLKLAPGTFSSPNTSGETYSILETPWVTGVNGQTHGGLSTLEIVDGPNAGVYTVWGVTTTTNANDTLQVLPAFPFVTADGVKENYRVDAKVALKVGARITQAFEFNGDVVVTQADESILTGVGSIQSSNVFLGDGVNLEAEGARAGDWVVISGSSDPAHNGSFLIVDLVDVLGTKDGMQLSASFTGTIPDTGLNFAVRGTP